MKKNILSAILISAAALIMPAQVVRADSVGDQLYDNDLLIDYVHDNMSFFIDYDTELRDGTVISVINEKGDMVPDGKGPSGSSNPLVSAIENPLSMAKRDGRATYSYSDDTFRLSPLTSDYYTFLGWNYDYSSVDGAIGTPAVTDASGLEKSVTIEKGSQGSRHYTAYWRQNLLTLLYKCGEDKYGKKASQMGASSYSVSDDGLILYNGDAKLAGAGAEGDVTIISPSDSDALNLYLADYHIEKGKEWVLSDGTVVSGSKKYLVTDIDKEIKGGDVTATLKANWVPNEYTLSYDLGQLNSVLKDTSVYVPSFKETENSDGFEASAIKGSYNKWSSAQKFTYETEGSLPVPSIRDYTFDGWYTADGKKVSSWSDVIGLTEVDNRNMKVTAKWKESEFKITYDFDREELPSELAVDTKVVAPTMEGFSIKGTHNSYNSEQTVTVAKTGTLPVPTREHYTFDGWYYGDTKVTTYGDLINLTDSDNRDCTVEAAWTPVKYQVTYDYDKTDLPSTLLVDTKNVAPKMADPLSKKYYTVSGTHNGYSTVLSYTVQNVGPLPSPQRNYYTFGGWQIGDKKVSDYKQVFNMLEGHIGTVEGIWNADTYTITYVTDTRTTAPDDCRSSIKMPADAVKTYTVETARGDLAKPSMDNYTFKAWNSSTNNKEVTTLSALEPLGNATLKAVWTPVEYTITWDNKGNRSSTFVGTPVNKNITKFSAETANDKSKDTLLDASCSGYTFKGWKLSDGTDVTKVSSLPLSNVTIRAQWDVINYTITYSSSDIGTTRWSYAGTTKASVESTMKSKNKTTYTVETASFSLVNPSITHEAFAGWTGSNGSSRQTSVTVAKGSTGNKTYTANFSESHSYGSYTTDTEATCKAAGSKHRNCTVCGHKDTASIAKKDHSYSWVTTKAATCTATGTRAYKCSVCGDVSSTKDIEKVPHTKTWVDYKGPTFLNHTFKIKANSFKESREKAIKEAYAYIYDRGIEELHSVYPQGSFTMKLDNSITTDVSIHYDTYDCIGGGSKGPASYTGDDPYQEWGGFILSYKQSHEVYTGIGKERIYTWSYSSGVDGYRCVRRKCSVCNNYY